MDLFPGTWEVPFTESVRLSGPTPSLCSPLALSLASGETRPSMMCLSPRYPFPPLLPLMLMFLLFGHVFTFLLFFPCLVHLILSPPLAVSPLRALSYHSLIFSC